MRSIPLCYFHFVKLFGPTCLEVALVFVAEHIRIKPEQLEHSL